MGSTTATPAPREADGVFASYRFTDYTAERVTRGHLAGMGHLADARSTEPSNAHLPPAEAGDPLGPYGYIGELAEFVRCALENRPPRIAADVRAGTRATRLALACFEGIHTGRTVVLEPVEP